MIGKLKLLSILVTVVAIINTSTAESNESISNSSFGYELTLAGLDAINFNTQQSHFRSNEHFQALSSDIESLKRTIDAIETLVTKQIRHISTLEQEIKELVVLIKSEDRSLYLRNEMDLLAFNVSRLLKDSSHLRHVQQTMPTTDMLNDLILQLLADRNTTGTKPPRLLLAEARNLPQTCAEVVDRRSGSYRVQPQPGFTDAFEVYCDQEYEGGGWLVIQNRYNGSVNFFRGWKEYEAGFGDLRGEFWLGLEKLHELTYVKPHELRIVLEDFDGTIVTAQYDRFIVGGAAENYVLSSLGNYSGNAGDSLTSDHLGMQFSTFDSDNDKSDENCANLRKAGWWYNSCADSNLNGLYLEGPQPEENYGIAMCWYKFRGAKYGLKRSRMMIRVVNDI